MKNGLVSVITACYNGERYLNKYFKAFLEQTYHNVELIIVDDGSTDKSNEIIKSQKELFLQRGYILKVVEQENKGLGGAYNTALKYIEGEFLCWVDVDDYYEKDAIEKQVQFLNNHKEFNLVRGKFKKHNGSKEKPYIIGSRCPEKNYLFDDYVFGGEEAYCYVGIWMIRMSCFDCYIKDRSIIPSRYGQDWQLLLPILYKEKVGYNNHVILNYVVHSDSMSHSDNTYKKYVEHEKNYESLLLQVLESTSMPEEEFNEYSNKVKKSYKNKTKRFKYCISKAKKNLINLMPTFIIDRYKLFKYRSFINDSD